MLKVDEKDLEKLEQQYRGIRQTILDLEARELPACPSCGSADTATVSSGIIGRTINIAGATTKFHLMASAPHPGKYFCNECGSYFGPTKTTGGATVLREGLATADDIHVIVETLTGKELTEEQKARIQREYDRRISKKTD